MELRNRPNPFAGLDSLPADYTPRQLVRTAVAGARSYVAPRRPDQRLLGSLAERARGPLPPATRTVRLQTLPQRPRSVPSRLLYERMPGADRLSLQSFVVHHPEATLLIDPAVPRDAQGQAVAELQPLLQRIVRPPATTIPTVEALDAAGVRPDFALSTHAHWDHVSGLLDLPGLPAILHDEELAWAAAGEQAPVGGVRRGLADRELLEFSLDGPPLLTFERSHDLFGDGSVVLVDLAGHTPGSVGVLLTTEDGPVLLVGDTAWHGLQIEQLRQRSGFLGCLVDVDREQTWRALHRLHALPSFVKVVPAHDHERASEWRPGE
ncbi:MBL fold metallo-hydrolase [Nocardioides sp. CCNWLW239]|uniref:MBL fold metallo-hydrolase n=1 Tax=Nocardioides sp. CCNWLW239 TaxID=3128902 RepID=UPI0030184068